MEDAGKILVVDDEQDLCEILQFNLETDGYVVDTANSAEEALKLTLTDYSLILLDVMMGDVSGFQMAERLKSHPSTSDIPIIFITALDNEDYMAKPLSMREVKARVRAVLRRNHRLNQTSEGEKEGRNALLRVDELTLDRQAKSVRIGNVPVDLTKLEFELLLVFLQNQGHLFSREELLAKVWPSEAFVTDRTVDVNITRLRKKIGRYGKCVKTKVGYGYYFENALR